MGLVKCFPVVVCEIGARTPPRLVELGGGDTGHGTSSDTHVIAVGKADLALRNALCFSNTIALIEAVDGTLHGAVT